MTIKIISATAVLAAVFSGSAFAQDSNQAFDTSRLANSSLYIGGAYSRAELDTSTGGFNTVGLFQNFDCGSGTLAPPVPGFPSSCSNEEDVDGWSVFAGFEDVIHVTDNVSVRIEGEYSSYDDAALTTGSFPGPPGPPAFFYRTTISDLEAGFANAYLDFDINDRLTLFIGGGIGASSVEIATNDFVVSGSGSETNFAYNIGFGASVEVLPGIDVFGNFRYVNFGKTDINLVGGGGGPAGNYTVDLDATEARVGVKVKLGEAFGGS
ncbi:MAG: outer membrane protein [Rhizobiaceae bacterium]